MRAVIYGAGNIGRGFIARLFAGAGWEIVFIDTAAALINALNRERRYPVRLLSPEHSSDVWVEGIGAVNGTDPEKTEEAIAGADIMATAVGVRILPAIAPVIAKGIRKRFGRTNDALNIIICENLIDADLVLGNLVKNELDSNEKDLFDQRIGLVKASIGCMVPIQTETMKSGNELRICTENYSILPVDKKAFRGPIPVITGMEAYDNFDFYIERKLFIHNMGHGLCAYFGQYLGDEYIYETTGRPEINLLARKAMLESANALSLKYNESIAELQNHIDDLISRFSNRSLGDTCIRVGADTARKLGERDRFIGAIRCCEEMKINPCCISAGAAAALFQYLKENNYKQTIEQAAAVLNDVSSVPKDSQASLLIICMYSLLLEKNAFMQIMRNCGAANNS